MSETKPRAEQVRFVSDLTGEHLLDEYIQACERAGVPLYELIDKIFDASGETNPDFLQFRIEEVSPGNYEFQYRSGAYVDPDAGWTAVSEDIFGAAATAAASALVSATTATTQAGIATTKAGEASTSAANALASEVAAASSSAAIDVTGSAAANDVLLWSTGPAKFVRNTIAQLRTAIGVISPALGGTGIANNAAATVTSSGNFAYTRTLTAATNVTFPTTGTLATRTGVETLTFKTMALGSNTISGTLAEFNTAITDGEIGATLGTLQNTTSGTNIDFTGIPAGVKEIIISFHQVSTNGTSDFLLQIGDSGGIENTGYVSARAWTFQASPTGGGSGTTGFLVSAVADSTYSISGQMRLVLMDAATNFWSQSHSVAHSGAAAGCSFGGGTKALSGTLDRIRLTTISGHTFDTGSMNIAYRY